MSLRDIFKKRIVIEVVLFPAIIAFFFILKVFFQVNLPTAQIIIFPFVVLFLAAINYKRHFFSYRALIFGVILALVAYTVPYMLFDKGSVLVTTLAGDDIENESREFWDDLNKSLALNGVLLTKRFYRQYDNHEAALAPLESVKNGGAVIWGNQRWINISYAEVPIYKVFGFKIVGGVNYLPIPYQPRQDTAKFIAALLTAGKLIRKDGSLPTQAEVELKYITGRDTLWLASFHKGLPWMMLGNGYLFEALRGGRIQWSFIECAIAAYRRALLYADARGNPELFAAINNNMAVTLYIKGLIKGEKKGLKMAKVYWLIALNAKKVALKRNGIFPAVEAAKSNLRVVTKSNGARRNGGKNRKAENKILNKKNLKKGLIGKKLKKRRKNVRKIK